MKKIVIGILFVFILGIFAQSCRTTKPPCPAYGTIQTSQNTANITR